MTILSGYVDTFDGYRSHSITPDEEDESVRKRLCNSMSFVEFL